MDSQIKRCPECYSEQNSRAKFCSECAYSFSNSHSFAESEKKDNTAKVILLTVLVTLGFVALAGGFYYLGLKTQEPTKVEVNQNSNISKNAANIAAQTAANAMNAANTAREIANNAATNAINSLNTNAVKITKPKPSPTELPDLSHAEVKRTASSVVAPGWTYLTQTTDTRGGSYLFYNLGSIRKSGYTMVWIREYAFYPDGFANENGVKDNVDYRLQRISFNCETDMMHVEEEAFIGISGSQIQKPKSYYGWQGVAPGTTMENLFEEVCK